MTEAGGARNEVPSIKGEIATKPSPSPKDLKSAISLQTGDASNSTPYWDIGVDGEGQYVQVVDTGFDDASCFLREGPKRNLTQVILCLEEELIALRAKPAILIKIWIGRQQQLLYCSSFVAL